MGNEHASLASAVRPANSEWIKSVANVVYLEPKAGLRSERLPAELLSGAWRRWQQAFESFDEGDEAENFQAVGVRLRECLLSFVGEARSDAVLPTDGPTPKASDFKGWADVIANYLAPGESASRLRSYLKKVSTETWDLVNWLTHAKSAVRLDAELGLKAVEHLLGVFTAARLRLDRAGPCCDRCGSYRVVAGKCAHCAWTDPCYAAPDRAPLSDEEVARGLSEPCTPSTDIATYVSPLDRHV